MKTSTLAQYKFESWMCTECGLRNAEAEPVCNECGECQPSTIRRRPRARKVNNTAVRSQRADQIQNNVSYNQLVIEAEQEEETPMFTPAQRTGLDQSLMIGANLVMWVSLWIIALVAIFLTTIVVLGLYKALG